MFYNWNRNTDLNDKTDLTQLNIRQKELLKNLYNMTDAVFKSNILLNKTNYVKK